jgi:hypothetical protein
VRDKKKTKKKPSELTPEQEAQFQQWWKLYPNKKDIGHARQTFRSKITTPELFERAIAAIKAQAPAMLRQEPQYRKHPGTWLNGECWEDETPPPAGTLPFQGSIYSEYKPMTEEQERACRRKALMLAGVKLEASV